jgi:hypothetical protein
VVTLSHDLHASVDELLPQLRFLPVHVVADCAAREGSDPCTDEGALATFAAVVARDDARDGAGGRTNHGALRRLRRLLVAGIGVRRGAGSEEDAEGQRAQGGRAGEILFHHFESEAILGSSLAAVQASRTTSPGNDIGFPFSALMCSVAGAPKSPVGHTQARSHSRRGPLRTRRRTRLKRGAASPRVPRALSGGRSSGTARRCPARALRWNYCPPRGLVAP